jgi:hypothetical protein
MQVIHPNKKTAEVTDGPFVDMSIGFDALDFALSLMTLPLWDCLLLALAGARTYRSNPVLL